MSPVWDIGCPIPAYQLDGGSQHPNCPKSGWDLLSRQLSDWLCCRYNFRAGWPAGGNRMQVTIQEAAQTLGVAESTVRRRLRNGELAGEQMTTPQGYTWLVELPDDRSIDLESEARPTGEPGLLRELVDSMRSHLDGLEGQLGTKDRQIEQLHVLLQQAQAALPAPVSPRSWWRRRSKTATA